ncbi:MAG: hypothetical protein COA58_04090 [Bacteroidetes bacterium]|nr:MAG: hypothetical protein COA58_04090 [Bacteroidota bacterium]
MNKKEILSQVPNYKKVYLVILCLCLTKLIQGQNSLNFGKITTTKFAIQNLNDQVDMPQSIAETIFIDKEGFLWITNYTGSLIRYDGDKIQTYKINGGIWQGSKPLTHTSITYNHLQNTYQLFGQTIPDERVLCFANITNGEIVSKHSPEETGIFLKSHLPTRNQYLFLMSDYRKSLLKLAPYSDSLISKTLCFAINSNEAYFLDHPTNKPEALSYFSILEGYKKNICSGINNLKLLRTHKNSLLILDPQKGILEFSKGIFVKTYPFSSIASDTLTKPKYHIQFVCQLNMGPPVIKLGNTLINISGETGNLKFNRLLEDVYINDIKGVVFTKNLNNIFISSATQGVFHLKKKKFSNTFSEGITNQGYYSTLEKNEILFTSTGKKFKIRTFELIDSQGFYYPSKITDLKGTLYSGSKNHTLRWDDDTQNWKIVSYVNGLGHRGDRLIYAVSPNNLVYYTASGVLATIDNETSYRLNEQIGIVNFLWFESNTRAWLGTNTGLYTFDTKKEILRRIEKTKNLVIRDIHPLNDSIKLLATYGQGLCLLTNGKILKTPNEKFNRGTLFSHRIIPDQYETFWMSTNSGLVRYSNEGLTKFINQESQFLGYQFFDKSDGFATNEFNGGVSKCGIGLSNGKIVFPSIQGLVHFDPSDVPTNEITRKVVIEAFADQEPFTKSTTLSGTVSRITFKISSPNYGNTKNLQLWYRLVSENTSWRILPQDGEISFTNLNSGENVFEVRRVFMNGIDVVEKFKFHIPKKQHETWWFKLIILLAILGIVHAFTHARISYLENAANKLQVKIEEQYEKLIAQNDQLEEYVEKLEESEGSLTKQMVLREKLMAIISHDVMGSLNSIRYISKELDLHKDKLGPSEQQQYHKNLHLATDNVYITMSKILGWIKTQREELVLHHDDFSLLDLFKEIQAYFALPSLLQSVKLENQLTQDIFISNDRQVLSSILHNLIENEIKHNKNTVIYLNSYTTSQKTIIQISNSTSQLDNLDKINEILNHKNDKNTNILKMQGGLGLLLIKELVEILDASVQYNSYQTNGHQIILQLKK